MPCEYCSQKASFFFTLVIGDQTIKKNLCLQCASEKELNDPLSILTYSNQLLLSDTNDSSSVPSSQHSSLSDAPLKTCPSCQFTIKDFQQTGRLGCPVCYPTFQEAIKDRLLSLHHGEQHCGHTPESLKGPLNQEKQILALRSQLRKAILGEHYEQAATIKQSIEDLQKESNSSS